MTTLVRLAPPSVDLQDLVPFRDCTPQEIAHVRQLARLVRAEAGEPLICTGDVAGPLHVIISGTVHIGSTSGLDYLLGPGDVVGEMAVLRGESASADVTTATACELLVFQDASALLEIPAVARRLEAIGQARHVAPARVGVDAASVPVVLRPPVIRGVGAGIHARTEVPARPLRLVGLAVVLLVVGAVGWWVVSQRNVATVVALEDVLAEARAQGLGPTTDPATEPIVQPPSPAPQTGLGAAPGPPSGAIESDPVAPEAEQTQLGESPVTAADPGPASDTSDATDDPSSVDAEPSGYRLPAPGVYSYATTGGDRISLAGARHQYPEVTHAVIRHTGGCGWSVEHHVLEEHVDFHDRCTDPDAVSVTADGREVEFYGQRDGLLYQCDPPATLLYEAADTVSTGTCSTQDGGSDAHYRGTRVGDETLDVGGEPVVTVHVNIEFEMTGDARGTSTVDVWLHPETGLIVREERVVDTYARAVWGDVRYQEEATFHLLSLTPQA